MNTHSTAPVLNWQVAPTAIGAAAPAERLPLVFDLSTATETDLLRAEIRNDTLRFYHSRGGDFRLCETLPLGVAVALAKALLTVVAANEYDEMLIARYEESATARADAISAHWGHD